MLVFSVIGPSTIISPVTGSLHLPMMSSINALMGSLFVSISLFAPGTVNDVSGPSLKHLVQPTQVNDHKLCLDCHPIL